MERRDVTVAMLQSMPPLVIDPQTLAVFGKIWEANGGNLSRTPPYSSGELGKIFDSAVLLVFSGREQQQKTKKGDSIP